MREYYVEKSGDIPDWLYDSKSTKTTKKKEIRSLKNPKLTITSNNNSNSNGNNYHLAPMPIRSKSNDIYDGTTRVLDDNRNRQFRVANELSSSPISPRFPQSAKEMTGREMREREMRGEMRAATNHNNNNYNSNYDSHQRGRSPNPNFGYNSHDNGRMAHAKFQQHLKGGNNNNYNNNYNDNCNNNDYNNNYNNNYNIINNQFCFSF